MNQIELTAQIAEKRIRPVAARLPQQANVGPLYLQDELAERPTYADIDIVHPHKPTRGRLSIGSEPGLK